MGETLKQVIERLKTQNSPSSKPVPVEKEVQVSKEEVPVEDESFDDLEEVAVPEPTKQAQTSAVSHQRNQIQPQVDYTDEEKQQQQIFMEIEMLHNDGRYRVELLHQLQEMNKALVVIAGVLVDISGGNIIKPNEIN